MVTFHVAANAADGSFSPSGDYIYTASLATRDPSPVEAGTWGRLKALFR